MWSVALMRWFLFQTCQDGSSYSEEKWTFILLQERPGKGPAGLTIFNHFKKDFLSLKCHISIKHLAVNQNKSLKNLNFQNKCTIVKVNQTYRRTLLQRMFCLLCLKAAFLLINIRSKLCTWHNCSYMSQNTIYNIVYSAAFYISVHFLDLRQENLKVLVEQPVHETPAGLLL